MTQRVARRICLLGCPNCERPSGAKLRFHPGTGDPTPEQAWRQLHPPRLVDGGARSALTARLPDGDREHRAGRSDRPGHAHESRHGRLQLGHDRLSRGPRGGPDPRRDHGQLRRRAPAPAPPRLRRRRRLLRRRRRDMVRRRRDPQRRLAARREARGDHRLHCDRRPARRPQLVRPQGLLVGVDRPPPSPAQQDPRPHRNRRHLRPRHARLHRPFTARASRSSSSSRT